VGTEPRDVCISGNKAFVVNLGDFTVSIIDLVNGTQTTVGVGIVPRIIKEVGNNKVIVFNADKSVSIIDVNDHSVVTIPEAVEGVGIERKRGICSVGSKVFVPGEESVSVIDLVNNQVTKIRVGVPPSSIHSCGNNNLVVLHSSGPEVSFIDVTDYTVTTLTVGKYREFHISGDKVCFTLYDDNSVSIIDVNTHQVSKVEVGVLPTAICFAGGKIFVGVGQRDRVSIIDLGADFQITNVAVGDTPGAMCSSGDKVFVSNQGSNNVSIIDVNDYTVTNVEVGESPGDICFSGDKVFVVNSGDNSISVIDLAQDNVVTLARLSSRGGSIAAAGEKVVVTHGPSNQVSIIDLTINNEAITEVRVGDTPIAVCISNQKAFVANYRSNNVSIIDLTNMRYQVTSVEVGRRPIALCTNGEKVFVANEDSNDVSIIDVASERVTSVVEVGDNQWKICVSGNKVFVLRRWRSVAVIDLANNNRVEEVAVGESPIDIWVAEEKAFVANQFSGSVSILSKSSGSKDFVPLSASEFLSYPNPFNRECYLPLNGKCKIYNILGQLVREIKISRSIYWDGRDTRGREVPTGLYFYEVVGKGVRRIVMLR
jgi:YVTN family beta-propeller protein